MIVAKLTVSFDRGARANRAVDLGLDAEPSQTADGGLVRGLGTHYVSAEEMERVKDCEAEDRRIRGEFTKAFLASPIPGLYVVPSRTAAENALAALSPAPNVSARVAVYVLAPSGNALPDAETAEWADRVSKQLARAPLGRGQFANAEGLGVLAKLAACPVLSAETRTALGELLSAARLERVTRVDFKRKLGELSVSLDVGAAVAPRRVRPVAVPDGVPADGPENGQETAGDAFSDADAVGSAVGAA